ncbi:MAG: hypothetical protein SFX19_03725 [Alphaproteobacteria bacterium]|nr:hypothetical protein [Alphaproteobacteria bacterium]
MTVPTSKAKKYVMGIDIGGTKIASALYEVDNSRIKQEPAKIFGVVETGGRLPADHAAQIAGLIKEARRWAREGALVAVGVGAPGRFRADGTLMPGSSPNVGPTTDAFDNVNLQAIYAEALNDTPLPVFVANDGHTMAAGLVESIKTAPDGTTYTDQSGASMEKRDFANKLVGYIGIGTGIGNAFVQTNERGDQKNFVTDGEIGEFRVGIDDEDWEYLHQCLAAADIVPVEFPEEREVRAEDLFSGPVIKALAGMGEQDNYPDPPTEAVEKALKFAGKYLARTIGLVKSGVSRDVNPANGWSDDYKAAAKPATIFLISGGTGQLPVIGEKLIQYAGEEMRSNPELQASCGDVRLVRMQSKDAAIRAAASLVPAAILSPASGIGSP